LNFPSKGTPEKKIWERNIQTRASEFKKPAFSIETCRFGDDGGGSIKGFF